MNNSQIANPRISFKKTAQLCLKTVLKVVFYTIFCVQIWIWALYAVFVWRKSMYLWICGRSKSANHKKIESENHKSAKNHICGRFANLTNYLSSQGLRISDLRNLFADCPTFESYSTRPFYTRFFVRYLKTTYRFIFLLGWFPSRQIKYGGNVILPSGPCTI